MKRASILVMVGCLAWSEAGQAEPPAEAAYHLVLARLLADEGQGSEASESFIRSIELAPDDPYIRLEYGKFLVRQRRLQKAAQQVGAAMQLAPQEPEVLRTFAEIQLKRIGQDERALGDAREALERLREIAPWDVESMVSLGQIYLSEQRPDQAAEVFSEVLDRASGNRMVYRLLVDALLRAGQVDRAEKTLREALAADPFFTRARVVLAEILGQQDRHQEAVAVLREAPETVAQDLELQKRLALDLHRSGDFVGALAAVDRVLEEEPGYYAGLYLKTVILSVTGENQQATELSRRLVALNPENLDVAQLLAQLLERQGQTDEALQELVRVEERLRLAGDASAAAQARAQQAVVLARAEHWQDVVEVLEPELPELEDSGQIELIFLYAEAQGRLGERGKAMAILSRFEKGTEAARSAIAKQAEILYRLDEEREAERRIADLMASEDLDDFVRAAEVYQRLERYNESIPILKRALRIEPNSVQILFWLGASYERTGRSRDAEATLESLLDLDPNFAPALNYLGYMWAEQGENLDRALHLVRQAVSLEPGNGAYVDSLGWAHFQLGQYEEARSYLERAANLIGEDAVVFEHLGDVYRVLGRVEEARRLYKRALALEDENAAQVQEKLDRLSGDS